VFILILGEDWPGVMYNYIRVYNGNIWVCLYFLSVFSLGNLMLLSLFTAILLQNFEGGDDDEEDEAQEASKHSIEDDPFSEDEPKIKKKPVSKCKSLCLRFKFEYICAFGTALD
jgi:hypothetical protein